MKPDPVGTVLLGAVEGDEEEANEECEGEDSMDGE
jgi:hypothetical protein